MEKGPSNYWIKQFLARHQELCFTTPVPLEEDCDTSSAEFKIKQFFSSLGIHFSFFANGCTCLQYLDTDKAIYFATVIVVYFLGIKLRTRQLRIIFYFMNHSNFSIFVYQWCL